MAEDPTCAGPRACARDARSGPPSAAGGSPGAARLVLVATTHLAARFDTLPPPVRLTVSILLSLALWGAILLGLRACAGDPD